MENILITGISGQDGIFLANILLNRDEELTVHGTSRGKNQEFINNQLKKVGTNNLQNLKIYNLDLESKNEVEDLINRVSPNKIFNLSGPSSVYDSFNEPKLTEKTILTIFNNLIEVLISKEIKCNFFQASSSEMFSPNLEGKIDESCKLEPNSPYAKAKVSNHKKLLNLIDEHEWNMTSGIMFNHESEFRENNYLTSKIINTAFQIYKKKEDKLIIGSLDYVRDWSFAGDIMDAASILTFSDAKGPYVLGSGTGKSIKDLVEIVFSYFNLDWEKYVIVDNSLLRSGDPKIKISDPSKIFDEFGWKTNLSFEDLIERCIENKLGVSF